jgi:hypothetical protein
LDVIACKKDIVYSRSSRAMARGEVEQVQQKRNIDQIVKNIKLVITNRATVNATN